MRANASTIMVAHIRTFNTNNTHAKKFALVAAINIILTYMVFVVC